MRLHLDLPDRAGGGRGTKPSKTARKAALRPDQTKTCKISSWPQIQYKWSERSEQSGNTKRSGHEIAASYSPAHHVSFPFSLQLNYNVAWIGSDIRESLFFPGTQVLCYTSATRRVLLLCIVVTAQRGCRDACFMTVVLPLFFLTTAAGGRKTLRCSLVCVRIVSEKRLS